VFLYVTTCLEEVYRRFRGTYCLHEYMYHTTLRNLPGDNVLRSWNLSYQLFGQSILYFNCLILIVLTVTYISHLINVITIKFSKRYDLLAISITQCVRPPPPRQILWSFLKWYRLKYILSIILLTQETSQENVDLNRGTFRCYHTEGCADFFYCSVVCNCQFNYAFFIACYTT
jgi:hypothetical protein